MTLEAGWAAGWVQRGIDGGDKISVPHEHGDGAARRGADMARGPSTQGRVFEAECIQLACFRG